MTKDEAKKIFITIEGLYPSFNSKGDTDTKMKVAQAWVWKLKKGAYQQTMKRLGEYADQYKFPPTVADILVTPNVQAVVSDYSTDKARVEKEKNDPELSKIRKQKLNNLKALMGGSL